jgi:hypothetical protein
MINVYSKGVGMIRGDFGPISETLYIDIIFFRPISALIIPTPLT